MIDQFWGQEDVSNLPPLRLGMLTATDLNRKYQIKRSMAKKFLKQAFLNDEVFKGNDRQLFMVKQAKNEAGFMCYALDENALPAFKIFVAKEFGQVLKERRPSAMRWPVTQKFEKVEEEKPVPPQKKATQHQKITTKDKPIDRD